MIKQFIKSIVAEKEGFSFDQPWQLEEGGTSVIIPIIRKTKKKRGYITLSEAQHVKIEDTGMIDGVYVKNEEEESILVSRGDIFKGKTQERAAIHDYIIKPNKGLKVAVRCVHKTKGISTGADMEYGGKTPYDIDLSNQGKTWKSINCYSDKYIDGSKNQNAEKYKTVFDMQIGANLQPMYLSSQPDFPCPGIYASNLGDNQDDLVGTIDELSENIKEAMRKIPHIDNQVGAIFIQKNEVLGLDVYDVPVSWEALKNDIIEKEGASFIEKDETELFTMQFDPKKTKPFIDKRLGVDFEEKVIYDREYKVIQLISEKLFGEGVIFQGKVIHLTLWKKQ